MSARVPHGWSEPDDNGVIRRHTMSMRASVRRMTDGPDRGHWLFWVDLCNRQGTREVARGFRPTRYKAAGVATVVLHAIGAQL